jgi:hypothetical protein
VPSGSLSFRHRHVFFPQGFTDTQETSHTICGICGTLQGFHMYGMHHTATERLAILNVQCTPQQPPPHDERLAHLGTSN